MQPPARGEEAARLPAVVEPDVGRHHLVDGERAHHDRHRAGADRADPDRGTVDVVRAGHHRRALGEAGQRGSARGDVAGDRRGSAHRRQLVGQGGQPVERQRVRRPLLGRHRGERGAGVGRVGGDRAGQAQPQPVLGEQQPPRAVQRRRFVVAQPGAHRRRRPGERRLPGQRQRLLGATRHTWPGSSATSPGISPTAWLAENPGARGAPIRPRPIRPRLIRPRLIRPDTGTPTPSHDDGMTDTSTAQHRSGRLPDLAGPGLPRRPGGDPVPRRDLRLHRALSLRHRRHRRARSSSAGRAEASS